jgi:5,10-methylene-tetrahydrofolate dehydrogenase/methenyl tetrahydrofolate cyclohydrolase
MAKDLKNEIRAEVEQLLAAGKRPPHLSALIVGQDPASATYVKNKIKAAEFTSM